MINIYGHFTSLNGKRYDITLTKFSSQTVEYAIDEDSDKICFDFSNPVNIETDYSDTFKHVIIKQATINLIVNDNFKDILFAGNERDFNVTIQVHNGSVLFKGYLDPLVFKEPYAKDWTKMQLSCSDKIATLQYIKYGEITDTDSNAINSNTQDKFIDIINNISEWIGLDVDTSLLTEDAEYILENTKINNSLLFGKSPDDWKKCDEVLEEIGKYAGIWFSQEGDNILKLFSWHESQRNYGRGLNGTDYAADDTNISVSDVYTQIRLTCNIEDQEDIVSIDSDKLTPVYSNKQKYLEEYISEGASAEVSNSFIKLINSYGDLRDRDEVYRIDNYAQVYESKLWKFGNTNYLNASGISDVVTTLSWLATHPGKGAFIGFANTDKGTLKDNSLTPSINLTQCLVISVMGKDSISDTSVIGNFSSYICSFTAKATALVPPDRNVTNYLVVSGKMLLNPLYAKSAFVNMHDEYFSKIGGENGEEPGLYLDSLHTFSDYKEFANNYSDNWLYLLLMNHTKIDYLDGIYLQRFMTNDNDTQVIHGDLKHTKYQEQWEYRYGDDTFIEQDKIIKIPILFCSLKVGNKYCVERIDMGASGMNRFEWLTQDQCTALNIQPYFSIGIDPHIGDKILGKDYDICNSIGPLDDVDGKGMAIPITFDDALTGDVEFKIVKPSDAEYEFLNKRYHGWWITEHEIVDHSYWPIIQKIQSIIIKNLKIELVSDKGHLQNLNEDADLVYASDENDNYIEPHEDDVMFTTMLTSYECTKRDVDIKVSSSHVTNTDGTPFLGYTYIKEGENKIYTKPEDIYVTNYYNEYSVPRTIVESSIILGDNYDEIIRPYSSKFTFSYIESGDFVPIGFEANLKENRVKYTMKNMS